MGDPVLMISDNVVSRFSMTEWLNVYDSLFTAESCDEKKTIQKILSWQVKVSHIPDAVICTRLFLEASVAEKDFHLTNNGSLDKSEKMTEFQMLYSVAIVQFVENFLSKRTDDTMRKDPVYVKFRDEIQTCYQHIRECKELLCLDLLRNASKACFDYLYVHYWNLCVDRIRSRVMTLAYCKQLASALVAVVYDFESLLPADLHMEASLTSLLTSLSSRKSSTGFIPTFGQLIQCAAIVAGLKRKDTMRALRRFKLLEVLSEPAFITVTSWGQTLRDALPRCLSFIETILHSSSHENVLLSFFKDFLFLVYDPDLMSNAPITLAVFWILSRVSVTLVDKLVFCLMYAITGLRLNKENPITEEFFSSNFTQYIHSISSQEVGCLDQESLSLWLRTMDVSSKQEKELKVHLSSPFGYRGRLLSWLRCLVLLPGVVDPLQDVVGLPDGLDFLLHLFCGPLVDSLIYQSGGTGYTSSNRYSMCGAATLTVSTAGGLKDSFSKRFLNTLITTQSRLIASCRCLLDFLAYVTVCFLLKKESVFENGLRGILRLFKDIDVCRSKNFEGPFMHWLTRRLESHVNTVPVSKRHMIQRCFFSTDRRTLFSDGEYKKHIGASLYDEFFSRVMSRQAKLQHTSALAEEALMREMFRPRDDSSSKESSSCLTFNTKSLVSKDDSPYPHHQSSLDCPMESRCENSFISDLLNGLTPESSSDYPSTSLPHSFRSKRSAELSPSSLCSKRQKDEDPTSSPVMESLSILLSHRYEQDPINFPKSCTKDQESPTRLSFFTSRQP